MNAPADYALREWHEQDGLPSDELAGVAQDAAGYLWVATNNGLARFDGTAFEPLATIAEPHTRGLARLAPAHAGDTATVAVPALARTEAREAGCLVLRDSSWRFEPEATLAGRAPRSVFRSSDASLWIGCEDGAVLRRRGERVTLFEAPPGLPARRIPQFAADSAGQVWILRANHLSRIDGETSIDVPLPAPEPELRLVSSATGGVWVFTRTALKRWDGTGLAEVKRLPDLLGAHFVQAAMEDSHGFLWIGTRSQGLFRLVGDEVKQVPTSSENITAVCEDDEGNIWAATNGGGLSRLRAKAHQLLDQSAGLKDNFSYTVAGDNTGAIWLANRDGGMARIQDGLLDPVSRRAGWRSFSTMSVHPAPDGIVWITTGVGVFRTRAANPESVEREPALNSLRNVRATFVARDGGYWLALDPDRVARWRDGSLAMFGADEGFDGREVRAFAEDAGGRIWLGAADGRLFRSSGERFERMALPGAENYGALQVIRFEPDGTILIGTTRHGVVIVPQGDLARTRPLYSEHGLPGNNVSQILVDDHDRHWFASRTGIFWIHGQHLRDFAAGAAETVHAIALGKDDGLPYLSCLGLYQPAAWKADDGSLWFATRRGVLRTDPALVAPGREAPPPVAIASIACDGHPQPLNTVVRLKSTVRRIELRLSALNLSAPESVQVRFRLEGYDNEWVTLGRDRMVTYPRLPPGRYVLNTMASHGSGAWRTQPAQLTLLVTPPWWQSRWAQFAYLAALVAAVATIVRTWSLRRLRRSLERAEHARAIEQERARIARNIHDDVGASLTRISLLTQAALDESTAHSPTLEKIYEATHAITRSMDEIVWAVNPRHDNTESLVYYLGNFAQSFLGAAGIRCRLESPPHLPGATLTSPVRHHLFLCCKEALHNIVKHAGATEAVMSFAVAGASLVIRIADNGTGIAAECGARGRPRGAPGDGLDNMRGRMAEVRGACSVTTEPSGGTAVTLSVPLEEPAVT